MNNALTINWKKIAARLKKERENKGLSHEKLAEELTKKYGTKSDKFEKRITKQTLIDYEVSEENHSKSGKVKGMSIENLYMLADFYEVSADYILCKTDYKSPDITTEGICLKTGLNENVVQTLSELNEFCTINNSLPMMTVLNKILDHKDIRLFLGEICKCSETVAELEEKIIELENLSPEEVLDMKIKELCKHYRNKEKTGEHYISPRKHLKMSLYLLQEDFIEIIEDIINSKNIAEKFDDIYNKKTDAIYNK